ncbi:hypothetical protein [Metabacillus fastidiosus]|uniref:hypothetical protein n=1 Tax=Metabacillus fastidiosus TaxID=1458 RepID=UPI003D27E4FA
MNKQILRLQKLLKEGKIDQAEYAEQLQELLDDEIIKQEDFDAAKDFEPEEDQDDKIYSQEDVNRMIIAKARKIVKKSLIDAGVDLEGIENKDLLATVGTLALQGQKKGNLSVNEAELAELQKKVKKFDDLQPEIENLTFENAVLKAAGKHNPLNPKQVVRALEDYKEYLEYDENDKLVGKSVDIALKKLAEAEPNLFKNKEVDEGEEDLGTNKNNFAGKPPGGGGTAVTKQEKLKAEGLAMLGISKEQ